MSTSLHYSVVPKVGFLTNGTMMESGGKIRCTHEKSITETQTSSPLLMNKEKDGLMFSK